MAVSVDFAVGESQTLIERCEQFEDEWFVTGEAVLPYTPRDKQELAWMVNLFLGEIG